MISVYNNKTMCCGCAVCENICPVHAIAMRADEEGFYYPLINQKLCIDCGMCKAVCAFGRVDKLFCSDSAQQVYAVKHLKVDVRQNSTSGGAFTALSDCVLNQGGSVYGAILDADFQVRHERADTEQARDVMRGSKYVQSNIIRVGEQIKADLSKGHFTLFIGSPCQVDGIQSYLNKVKAKIEHLVTVDFICHGVPNQKMFDDFIAFIEKKRRAKLVSYAFRPKNKGWRHVEMAEFSNGKQEQGTALIEVNRRFFHGNIAIRPSCHHCDYTKTVRCSDITIADFWGIEAALPGFKDDLGVSAIIVNTKKGEELLRLASSALDIKDTTMAKVSAKQKHMHHPTQAHPRREQFFVDYHRYGYAYVARIYGGYNFFSQAKRLLKRVVGRE